MGKTNLSSIAVSIFYPNKSLFEDLMFCNEAATHMCVMYIVRIYSKTNDVIDYGDYAMSRVWCAAATVVMVVVGVHIY